jgi:DnaJ-class molecular chaperone
MSTHYEVLGVSRDASIDEIKSAYRKLSLKWHPDRCPPDKKEEAQSRFQEIGAAYETLNDERRRQEYNAELDGFRMGGSQEVDMSDIINMMFGGAGMPFGMPGMGQMQFGGGGGPGIHIFHSQGQGMPGMGGFHQHIFRQMHKPQPIIKQIDVSFEQAYAGCTLHVNVEKWEIKNDVKIHAIESVYVSIHQGVDNGEIIIMRDCGNTVSNDLKGDIKFIVNVIPSPIFERQGMDIVYKRTISLKESLTGFSFEIAHVNGRALCLTNMTNRTIIAPNYRKSIPGLGMTRDGNVGNLVIVFDVSFPDSLTDEQTAKILEIL